MGICTWFCQFPPLSVPQCLLIIQEALGLSDTLSQDGILENVVNNRKNIAVLQLYPTRIISHINVIIIEAILTISY